MIRPIITINEEEAKKVNEKLNLLNQRYDECNLYGHLKPAEKENTCYHCYRRLEYETPKADAIVKTDNEFPLMMRPMNAPIVMEIAQEERRDQELIDRRRGLQKIAEEFNLS